LEALIKLNCDELLMQTVHAQSKSRAQISEMIAIMGSFVFARERKGIIGGVCAARCIYLCEPGAWSHAAALRKREHAPRVSLWDCCENRAQLRLLRGVCGGDWG
jgi:hypothetical protein